MLHNGTSVIETVLSFCLYACFLRRQKLPSRQQNEEVQLHSVTSVIPEDLCYFQTYVKLLLDWMKRRRGKKLLLCLSGQYGTSKNSLNCQKCKMINHCELPPWSPVCLWVKGMYTDLGKGRNLWFSL